MLGSIGKYWEYWGVLGSIGEYWGVLGRIGKYWEYREYWEYCRFTILQL